MDLVNLMYRYINRFINSEELINGLEDIDLTKYQDEEKESIKKLISDVKNIRDTIPNEIDEIEKKRLSNIEHILELMNKNLNNESFDEKAKEQINKTYNSLIKEKSLVKDGGKLYNEIFNLMTNYPLVCKYAKSMNNLELLEFIAQYISAPLPPKITQEEFDELVDAGIKEDKREALWRLAFNYEKDKKDFSKIEDYFIEKRDHYYLAELISAVEKSLDLDKIIEKALKTKDYDFISKMASTEYLLPIFTDEQKEKVKKYLELGDE